MLKIERLIQSIPSERREAWSLDGPRIDVALRGGSRHQTVTIERLDHVYRLTSVVLGSRAVTKNAKRWNRLAILAWERNEHHQIVAFGFDRRDRLVGQIEHQDGHLHLWRRLCTEMPIDQLQRPVG